jgi:hypothetical protein
MHEVASNVEEAPEEKFFFENKNNYVYEKFQKVPVVFDSGSNFKFISCNAVKELKLEIWKRQTLPSFE